MSLSLGDKTLSSLTVSLLLDTVLAGESIAGGDSGMSNDLPICHKDSGLFFLTDVVVPCVM